MLFSVTWQQLFSYTLNNEVKKTQKNNQQQQQGLNQDFSISKILHYLDFNEHYWNKNYNKPIKLYFKDTPPRFILTM